MKKEKARSAVCPKCGRTYTDVPSLSRLDNTTLICPDCGTREALDSLGVDAEEQEQVLAAIHRSMGVDIEGEAER